MPDVLPDDPALWGQMLHVSPDALLVYDLVRDRRGRCAAFRRRLVNPAAQHLLSDPRVAGILGVLPETATEDVFDSYASVATSGVPWSFDKTLEDEDGKVGLSIGVEVRLVAETSVLVRISDVTERLRQVAVWKEEAQRLRLLARRSRDVLVLASPAGEILWVSEAAQAVLGRADSDLMGRNLLALIAEKQRSVLVGSDGTLKRTGTVRAQARGREGRWLEARIEDRETHRIVVLRDVTALRNLEETVQELSGSAGLPGVVNRKAFLDQLVKEVARRQRYGRTVSVAAITLDRRTQLRRAGVFDDAQRALAEGANEVLRIADLIGAWSEDVFLVLLPETPVQGAVRACARLNEQLAERDFPGRGDQRLTVSAGITAVDFGDDGKEVLRRVLSGLAAHRKRGPATIAISEDKRAA